MRILVADDDFVNRRFLEKTFSVYGEVDAVDNGMTAVESATKAMDEGQSFDLICLDIMMTKLDGYKTLEAIREAENQYQIPEERRAKVVMISALDEVVLDNIQVCDDYDAYICKPIVMDKFEKLLGKMGFSKLAEA
jgi:two-component system chemotaxis response regulator CheY